METEQFIKNRISDFKKNEPFINDFLRNDAMGHYRQLENDKINITEEVEKLERVFNEISQYIRKIREHIGIVLDEQNKLTASYFIFGKIFQTWQALFILMRGGFHYETIGSLRSIIEAADLITYLMSENNANPDLKKWFVGDIVGNAKTRKAMQDLVNKKIGKFPIKDIKDSIYDILSKYIHISYAALLDSYNVYTKDFDFERIGGFHYMQATSLPCAQKVMINTIMTLGFFYECIGDNESYEKLDSILEKLYSDVEV